MLEEPICYSKKQIVDQLVAHILHTRFRLFLLLLKTNDDTLALKLVTGWCLINLNLPVLAPLR